MLASGRLTQLHRAGLGCRRPATGQRHGRVEYAGYRLHRRGDVVRDRLIDALVTAFLIRVARVEKHLAFGVDNLLHQMRLVVDAGRGERGVRRGHVDGTSLVLAQHDPVVGWSAVAVLGQRVRDAGKTGRDAGLVRGVRRRPPGRP